MTHCHCGFLEHWNRQKSVTFDNVFHVYLMRGYQKYARNWILTMAFWATCKIPQPSQPIWQHLFALPWSALKKPPWEFNFFHIFGIPSSSRHEKRCQMLQTLFCLFQCSKNPQWNNTSHPVVINSILMITDLFVTSENETTNSPIHQFKDQRAFCNPFLLVYFFLSITVKNIWSLAFSF